MSYTHLTLDERIFLHESLRKGLSLRKIAEYMDRSPSTLSREIRRNKSRSGYYARKADEIAKDRRKASGIKVLLPGSEEYIFAEEKLKSYWPPEAICGRWTTENPDKKPIHFSTIYRHIKQGLFPGITSKDNLRRRGNKPKSKHGGQMTILPNRLIRDWPEEIKTRSRIGDWEGDTIAGKIGSGLITTLVDRKSRYLLAGKVENKQASVQKKMIEELLKDQIVESISLDNGVEFAEHMAIEKTLQTRIYFADPHCPWQRGSNENINGLLRFFFPRGSDFREITQEHIDEVVKLMNGRPRKCLGWLTPEEVYMGVALP